MFRRQRSDRGAAAVEFALVVPILLLLVFGIAEFGRAYQVQTSLSAAARHGARIMALQNDSAAAIDATVAFDPELELTASDVTVSLSDCDPGLTVTVTAQHTLETLTGFIVNQFGLTGTGSMRCGG